VATIPPALARLFNRFGGGLVHMELFPEGPTMCCEILVGGEDVFIWAADDLIYCFFEA
jgi:hypothetical protein